KLKFYKVQDNVVYFGLQYVLQLKN
ncbi:MAG: hypothetical protein ACI8RD_003667, partial [Bacillariaceae sp.]